MFCTNCGKEIDDKAAVCIGCGYATKNTNNTIVSKKGLAVILAIFFGNWGIARFYLGDIKNGMTLLIFSLICLLLSWLVIPVFMIFVIWLLELISICKLDEDKI